MSENTQPVEGTTVPQEVKQVKVSDVIAMLDRGLSRKEIAAELGMSVAQMSRTVFQHAKLKNRKAKVQDNVVMVDDTEEPVASTPQEDFAPVAELGTATEEAPVATLEHVEELAQTNGPAESMQAWPSITSELN